MSEQTRDFQGGRTGNGRNAGGRAQTAAQAAQSGASQAGQQNSAAQMRFAVPDSQLQMYARRHGFKPRPLNPLEAHKILPLLPCQQPDSRVRFGWVQPLRNSRMGFYLGMFPNAQSFAPFAFVDARGNVHTLESAEGLDPGAELTDAFLDDGSDVVMSLVRHDSTEAEMEPIHADESFETVFGEPAETFDDRQGSSGNATQNASGMSMEKLLGIPTHPDDDLVMHSRVVMGGDASSADGAGAEPQPDPTEQSSYDESDPHTGELLPEVMQEFGLDPRLFARPDESEPADAVAEEESGAGQPSTEPARPEPASAHNPEPRATAESAGESTDEAAGESTDEAAGKSNVADGSADGSADESAAARATQSRSAVSKKLSRARAASVFFAALAKRKIADMRASHKRRATFKHRVAQQPTRPIETGYLIFWQSDSPIRLARVKKMPNKKHPGAQGTYELSEFRQPLPAAAVRGLDYRNMMTLGFFSLFFLPQLCAAPTGWGISTVVARLHTEAALAALRHSAIEIMESQAAGWNVSASERFFLHVMRDCGVMAPIAGLEAEHGKEKLMLGRDRVSGMFMLVPDTSISVRQMLAACRIEGAINRFFAVATVLEWNRHFPTGPIEAIATPNDIAQIDADLFKNPALLALPPADDRAAELLPIRERAGVRNVMALARATGAKLSAKALEIYPWAQQLPVGGATCEWAYRQTLSGLLTGMQLPFRYLTQFHSDVNAGRVALGVTAVSRDAMPASRHDEALDIDVQLDDAARNRMATDYSLRIGLIAAAAAFGASDAITQVQVQIDSIGLAKAVREQDAAAMQLADAMARALDEIAKGAANLRDGKGSPKDGDVHGDADVSMTFPSQTQPVAGTAKSSDATSGDSVVESALASHIEDVISGSDNPAAGDTDEVAADTDEAAGASDSQNSGSAAAAADSGTGNSGDPIADGMAKVSAESIKRVVKHAEPKLGRLVTVSFSRAAFLTLLDRYGMANPVEFYKAAGAAMEIADDGELTEQPVLMSWSDSRFTPSGAQEEPEIAGISFDKQEAGIFGTSDSLGLSIQRADVLAGASERFSELSSAIADGSTTAVAAAEEADKLIRRIDDPELNELSPKILASLIDGDAIQPVQFTVAQSMRTSRVEAKELLFSGDIQAYIKQLEEQAERGDEIFAGDALSIPRYFNSYAERVVYNKLFAQSGEKTVLIPDDLFYAHFELGQLLAQFNDSQEGLKHLNKAVAYAPTYPMAHLQQSIQFSRIQDWDSARASALNALRVTLDRDDAAFAYYRYAYSEWMHDEYAVAAAAYIFSDAIHPNAIPALNQELDELRARMELQAIPIPRTLGDAVQVLREAGVPVWPQTDVTTIVRSASVLAVNRGLFVPARTLAMAAARMRLFGMPSDGVSGAQALFIGSLNA